jgi:predicted DCC family thiol-disulfide oxidoreductase YuxK
MSHPDLRPRLIVYDGECPFCSRYVKLLRLRESLGSFELIDARTGHPAARDLAARGFDLDEGMALIDGESVYFGDECVHRLALMSTPVGAFNRLNAAIFRSPRLSALLYPALRAGRNATLFLLGRRKIRAGEDRPHPPREKAAQDGSEP